MIMHDASCILGSVFARSLRSIFFARSLEKLLRFSAAIVAMLNRRDAMQVLELLDGFSKEQLKKQYIRMSLAWHPDKPGGNTEKMQMILECYKLLVDSRLDSHPEPPETSPPNWIAPPASAPPPEHNVDRATAYAAEFLAKLKEKGPQHRTRLELAGQILSLIHISEPTRPY